MNREEIIEQQNAYYMAGYPSRRSEIEMGKDEMKNKISMALKDPILQQGFELVCKENTELQNENAKLKQYIENMYANHCGNCNRNILNTELKNRNQELLESCQGATMMYKDLQKAKEIIKKLLHTLENKDSEYTFALKPTHPILVEAKQFIREGETKNE